MAFKGTDKLPQDEPKNTIKTPGEPEAAQILKCPRCRADKFHRSMFGKIIDGKFEISLQDTVYRCVNCHHELTQEQVDAFATQG